MLGGFLSPPRHPPPPSLSPSPSPHLTSPSVSLPPPPRWYSSWDEAKDKCYKLDPSMFPSPSKAKLPMERCMRFLPHHQDTGGFFVCVLRKVRCICLGSVCDAAGTAGRAVPPSLWHQR